MFNPYDYYITPEEYEEAARNGINRNTLDARIRRYAWVKQRAVTEPVQVQKDRTEIKKLMKAHGISYENFKNRTISLGWDDHSAATVPLQNLKGRQEHIRRVIELNRRYPREMMELAESNGISSCLFRVQSGNLDGALFLLLPCQKHVPIGKRHLGHLCCTVIIRNSIVGCSKQVLLICRLVG
ncbi:hypothetical protein O9H85_15415 [Paenibacillus filicis]|uniref:Uncharacterized protein n=1 Tax=Paenibacillus gyeongsangnamensis TaxID=3388067 RepID=A0ABT4QA89_9BACL|nr:hypothetical protein [Paenibacillus filicis]MCZ8513797.1 hypothetical protein [Paenibacillus filicis]